ncbi:SAM domain-containing protein [Elsinoe fawcettii]|nr:SAM domain-containing protein [Elsinoe fawcettii]
MTALQRPTEMALRSTTPLLLARSTSDFTRPVSQATDNFFTEFEDDESDAEQSSLRSSNQSLDDVRRRSDTTISSYEVPTPQTESDQFEIRIKPVQGPQGPHLFRASTSSAEFIFDYALQMSPVELKTEPPPRPSTAKSHRPSIRMSRRSLPPVYANIPGMPANIHDWSSEVVIDWMFSTGVDFSIIQSFRNNDITGTVLVDMTFEDLKDLGIPSFGKRHQLWSSITALKGGEAGPSPSATPFQDLTSPTTDLRSGSATPLSACSATEMEDLTPITEQAPKKRRGRKHRAKQQLDQQQIDLSAMSFIAIEEHIPKEHECSKGQDCEHWRKWKRRVDRSKKFNDRFKKGSFPSSPGRDGTILIHGDPGNAATAPNLAPRLRQAMDSPTVSEVIPSIVASSDVLGPDQLPDIYLHEDMLQSLDKRDPQENVKHFLHLQHISSPMDAPEVSEYETFDEPRYEMFPSMYHQTPYVPHQAPAAPLQVPRHTPAPLENLKHLPKLSIPRAATASPTYLRRANTIRSPVSAVTPSRSLAATPIALPRASTPASEMDVPVTAPNLGPIARDTSQSVPPNMQYREQLSSPLHRSNSRRPSFALPPLREEGTHLFYPLSPSNALSRQPTVRRASDDSSTASSELARSKALYGEACTRSGWMKKRRTRLLRHEWSDAHFRLTGTQLAMHRDEKQISKPKDTIDVDLYTINASSGASNGKLSAALKAMRIREEKAPDGTAFAFQLVPEGGSPERKLRKGGGSGGVGKTHHFAVGDREERVEWMRELMLAQAKGKKNKGFEVRVG